MKLIGDNPLHLRLEQCFGEHEPYPSYEPDGRTVRRRAAWRCPACGPTRHAPHRLEVALDRDGDPPKCLNGCSEDTIWRSLGGKSSAASLVARQDRATSNPDGETKRTRPRSVPAEKRTPRPARPDGKRTPQLGGPHRDVLLSEDISKGAVSKEISQGSGVETQASRNIARAGVLGIPAEIGTEFPCVLPGHQHAAKLIPHQGGFWRYQCPGTRAITLAELRAARDTGRVLRLSKTLASRWLERLDYEAGLLIPRRIKVSPPPNCSPATRNVAQKIALLLGLRGERWPSDEPFTFARSFAIAYCGVTDDAARHAMKTLEQAEVIRRVNDQRRKPHDPIEWQLGGQAS